MGERMVTVAGPTCPHCKKKHQVIIPESGYYKWLTRGEHIQKAMPTVSADDREVLLTGYNAECWDADFPELENE